MTAVNWRWLMEFFNKFSMNSRRRMKETNDFFAWLFAVVVVVLFSSSSSSFCLLLLFFWGCQRPETSSIFNNNSQKDDLLFNWMPEKKHQFSGWIPFNFKSNSVNHLINWSIIDDCSSSLPTEFCCPLMQIELHSLTCLTIELQQWRTNRPSALAELRGRRSLLTLLTREEITR